MNQELHKYELKDIKHVEYLENLCHEIGVRFKTDVKIDTSNWFATNETYYYLESNNKNKLDYVLFEYNKYVASYNYAKQLEDECVLKNDDKDVRIIMKDTKAGDEISRYIRVLQDQGYIISELNLKKDNNIKLKQIVKHWIKGFNF